MPITEIVDVRHVCTDGYHKFTSPQVPGLYLIAEQEHLEEVYAEIPQVIAAIINADFKSDVQVTIQKSYAAYENELPPEFKPEFSHYSVVKRVAA